MADKPPCDIEVRERVTSDLATTYLLEAGAGTGKTRVLVERYVRCVLDPDLGAGDVRAVAAITFTEKAAGELRQRIREELERLDAAADPGSEGAARLRAALDALDDAPIGTIHGFAGRLLREFPVEAGVDPAFEQLDGLGSDLERARLWQEWITELAAGESAEADGPRAWVRRLLRAGARLDHLRALAIGKGGLFGERYDIDRVEAVGSEPDVGDALGRLSEAAGGLRAFCDVGLQRPVRRRAPGRAQALRRLREGARRCARRPRRAHGRDLPHPLHREAGRAGRSQGQLVRRARRQGRALGAVPGGHPGGEGAPRGLRRLPHGAGRRRGRHVLALGRGEADRARPSRLHRPARPAARSPRRPTRLRGGCCSGGSATCSWTSSRTPIPCRRRSSSCSASASRWRTTGGRWCWSPASSSWSATPSSPSTASAAPTSPCTTRSRTWWRGSRATPAGSRRSNRTSAPRPVSWPGSTTCSRACSTDEQEKGRQPGYQWVEPYRLSAEGSRVTVLLGPPYDGSAGSAEAARRDEARAVAATILGHVRRGRRTLAGPRGERSPAGRRRRAPPAGATSRCSIGPPPAWRRSKKPCARPACRIGWTAARRTSSVARSTTPSCVCAPSTIPATGRPCTERSTRRSSASPTTSCSCSGPRAGASTSSPSPSRTRIRASPKRWACCAICTACGLPASRTSCSRDLVRRTRAADVLAATGPGGAQAIANLEQLVERARAFAGAGGGGLAAFLAWAAEAGDAAGEQESQVDDEGDLVHLLTIHKAKGLEYPIVVVYGGARAGGARRRRADRRPLAADASPHASRWSCPARRRRRSSRSPTRTSRSARSSWPRASCDVSCTWRPRGRGTTSSSATSAAR